MLKRLICCVADQTTGQIAQRRNGEPPAPHHHHRAAFPYPGANRGHAPPPAFRGRGGFTRGRVFRGAMRGRGAPHFRNRVLVLNGGAVADSTPDGSDDSGTATPNDGWVAKVDRHQQLINANVYEKVSQERAAAIEATKQQKLREKTEREKAKLQKHVARLAARELKIHDVRYRVAKGGSKLVRLAGECLQVSLLGMRCS